MKHESLLKNFTRRALKTAYLLTLVAIFAWSLPFFQSSGAGTSIGKEVQSVTGPFFRWTGLWQGWAMFAPNPSNLNLGVQAAIEYRDGSIKFVMMPEMHKMSRWQAYRSERHRKFADNFRRDSCRRLWPRATDYYRETYTRQNSRKKQIVRIDLVRWWSTVDEPDFTQPPPQPPEHNNFEKSFIFYTAKYPAR